MMLLFLLPQFYIKYLTNLQSEKSKDLEKPIYTVKYIKKIDDFSNKIPERKSRNCLHLSVFKKYKYIFWLLLSKSMFCA